MIISIRSGVLKFLLPLVLQGKSLWWFRKPLTPRNSTLTWCHGTAPYFRIVMAVLLFSVYLNGRSAKAGMCCSLRT